MHSILIADSHNLYREALCNYIGEASTQYKVDGVTDYKEMVACLERGPHDLLLIESELPGWEAQADIFLQEHDTLVIGLIVPLHGEHERNPRVKGVFPKTLSCKAFIAGIEDIFSGRNFFPSADISDTHAMPFAFPAGKREFGFTAREREVLTYLVKGMTNKDIARALDLQVVTVKLHVRGLCRKMKAANRTQAALLAKENGWG